MRSGTKPTYRIEMIVQNEWRPTIHVFNNRTLATRGFKKLTDEHPTWWLRLVRETVLKTVTP